MIDAIYYDGKSTRRVPVTVIIHKRVVAMRGAGVHRTIRLSKLAISERLQYAPRILRFPEGDFIEVQDKKLDKVLKANRYQESWVVRWQQNWPLSLMALVLLVGLLISGYQWGLPAVVEKVALNLPPEFETKIGDQTMAMLDKGEVSASTLPKADQERLRRLFAQMKQPRQGKTAYRLEFRNGAKIGPNAFALPNGVIIMTDQLVRLAGNDEAVLGVLGHELGHVQRRHFLRNMLQTVGVGVVFNLIAGDVSSILTVTPALLLDKKYSRDFEREADDFAIEMMKANKLSLLPMATLFDDMQAEQEEAMQRAAEREEEEEGGQDGDEEEKQDKPRPEARRPEPGKKAPREAPNYMSTHPSNAERTDRLRAAQ
jgi:Zn-dependent protease with chaperone function